MPSRLLLPSADEVVRSMLPVALESAGRRGCAERLRSLSALRDAGSVWRAMVAVERVAASGGDPLSEAARLCGDAAAAALRGDGAAFSSLVRRACAALRPPRAGSSLN